MWDIMLKRLTTKPHNLQSSRIIHTFTLGRRPRAQHRNIFQILQLMNEAISEHPPTTLNTFPIDCRRKYNKNIAGALIIFCHPSTYSHHRVYDGKHSAGEIESGDWSIETMCIFHSKKITSSIARIPVPSLILVIEKVLNAAI